MGHHGKPGASPDDASRAGGFALFVDWSAEVERPAGPPRDHVYSRSQAAERLTRAGFAVEPLPPLAYHYALRARLRP